VRPAAGTQRFHSATQICFVFAPSRNLSTGDGNGDAIFGQGRTGPVAAPSKGVVRQVSGDAEQVVASMRFVFEIPPGPQEPIVRVLQEIVGQLIIPGAPEQEHPHGPGRAFVEPVECFLIHLEGVDVLRRLILKAFDFRVMLRKKIPDLSNRSYRWCGTLSGGCWCGRPLMRQQTEFPR